MANDTDADFPLLNAALPSAGPAGVNDAGATDVSGLRVAVGEPSFPYRAFDNLDRIHPGSVASRAAPADPSPLPAAVAAPATPLSGLAGLGGIEPPAPCDGGVLSGLAAVPAAAAPASSFPASARPPSAPSDAPHGLAGLAGLGGLGGVPAGGMFSAPAAQSPAAQSPAVERAPVRSPEPARGISLREMFSVLRRAAPPAGPSDTSLRDIFR
ncbi:hypothetical protein AA13595_1892 [Gluconacetobacter johannae DSM 13595]|uniref:Uncharacterized protein n=1 Tax=Gluconacetobacter johannae TaxID=112140 RepID=A0A7W4J8X5_9PROT|nr:hypothetical protein [Gluconacetobacter johannae]MBB2176853.1 hypothetical protein [Gluconacetobacter johannae]GBQ86432.1 hypothetical protein AA13595_1892 [Gluconacetobacter johannae DSM 13595]